GVRISIADSGHGIRHEHLASIFDPFFTTKGEKGTGLGLWVSHGIVQKYGGTIHVHSSVRPGHSGTCFSVFFPQTAVVDNLRKPVRRAKSQV
ncbi:MAG TPA: ATP-binding protein, partial [Terriglobales bacterium]|nr:ATP-binding protein [Terriglobales bacterium]